MNYYTRDNASRYKSDYEKMDRALEMISSHMTQLFLRKQKTREYHKTQFKKTGILDTQSLSKHKLSEDIFIRKQIDYKGDSYGFVVLFDMSGSMSSEYLPCILQILLFAKFCKKAGLPFDVYGFSDFRVHNYESEHYPFNAPPDKCRLYNFLSSSSSKLDFQMQSKAFYYLARAASEASYVHSFGYGLSGTPLNNSMFECFKVVDNFQQKHKKDITHLIVITDGDATDTIESRNELFSRDSLGGQTSLNIKYKNKSYFYDVLSNYETLVKNGLIRNRNDNMMYHHIDWKPAQYHTLVSALRKHFGQSLKCHEFYIHSDRFSSDDIKVKVNNLPQSFNTFICLNKSVFGCFDVIQRSDFWNDVESLDDEGLDDDFDKDIYAKRPKQVENVKKEINKIGRDMTKSLVKTKSLKIISEKIVDLLV
jgi:hypothetical protein